MAFTDLIKQFKNKFRTYSEPELIPTGSIVFDAVLGGGIPTGHFIELTSPSGLGKTTSVLHFCKTICANGGKVLYLDFENGVNSNQIDCFGLKKYLEKEFVVFQATTFEDAEELLDAFLQENISLVVIDSITSMIPRKLMEGSVTDVVPGVRARLQAEFLVKYKNRAREFNTPFIFVNQMRTKINMMGPSTVEAAGGNAQKFFMDIRLQMAMESQIKAQNETADTNKEIAYGVHAKVWALKTRFTQPYIERIVTIYFGKGISDIAAYVRMLVKENKVVKKNGAFFTVSFPKAEEKKLHGEAKLQEWIKDNLDVVRDYVETHLLVDRTPGSDEAEE